MPGIEKERRYNPVDAMHETRAELYAHRDKFWPSDKVRHIGPLPANEAIALLRAAIKHIEEQEKSNGS